MIKNCILLKFPIVFLLFLSFSAKAENSFKIIINKEKSELSTFSIFVMPGHNIDLAVISEDSVKGSFNGTSLILKNNKCSFKAPAVKGRYELRLNGSSGDSMVVNIFVKVPISEKKGEYLNGYRIGNYPLIPLNNEPVYERPKGFVEINESDLDVRLTPNYTLGDFVCKQEGTFPKYAIIKERLLLKLEYLTNFLRSKNVPVTKFRFISAYRTPYYNKAIGNVRYSRHIYGGAADIYIDEDGDGRMDDLNRDGKLDHGDAQFLFRTIEGHSGAETFIDFIGGMGIYKRTEAHPSFIHIDTRGFRARW